MYGAPLSDEQVAALLAERNYRARLVRSMLAQGKYVDVEAARTI